MVLVVISFACGQRRPWQKGTHFPGPFVFPSPLTKENAPGQEKIRMPLCEDDMQKSRSVDVFKSLGVRCEVLPWSSLSSAWLVASGGLGKTSLACRGRLCYPHQPPPRRGVRLDLSACVPPPFTIAPAQRKTRGVSFLHCPRCQQLGWWLAEAIVETHELDRLHVLRC